MAARYFEGVAHAAVYSKFRPSPPASLISRIVKITEEKFKGPLTSAVDVGCGSGQSTFPLAAHFTNVTGLDISQAQLSEAIQKNTATNITFKESPAETLPFENNSVQLVTVGQASHWFDLPKFYKEVERILVPNGILAMYCYYFPEPIWKDKGDELFKILNSVYLGDMKKYWGKERILVDNHYTDEQFTIPFGENIREKDFISENTTTLSDIVGYITTWSGFQNYKRANGEAAGQAILDNFVHNMMNTIGEDKQPEEIELTLRYNFYVLFGSKPSS